MIKNDLVQIRKFDAVGEDERGFTSEFSLPRKQDEFVFVSRKAGTLSGNTYHEGKTSATKPKVLVLLSGKILFSYRKIGTEQSYSHEVNAPAIMEIIPQVTHRVEAIEDFLLLECNSIKDIQMDRIREEV